MNSSMLCPASSCACINISTLGQVCLAFVERPLFGNPVSGLSSGVCGFATSGQPANCLHLEYVPLSPEKGSRHDKHEQMNVPETDLVL